MGNYNVTLANLPFEQTVGRPEFITAASLQTAITLSPTLLMFKYFDETAAPLSHITVYLTSLFLFVDGLIRRHSLMNK